MYILKNNQARYYGPYIRDLSLSFLSNVLLFWSAYAMLCKEQ